MIIGCSVSWSVIRLSPTTSRAFWSAFSRKVRVSSYRHQINCHFPVLSHLCSRILSPEECIITGPVAIVKSDRPHVKSRAGMQKNVVICGKVKGISRFYPFLYLFQIFYHVFIFEMISSFFIVSTNSYS